LLGLLICVGTLLFLIARGGSTLRLLHAALLQDPLNAFLPQGLRLGRRASVVVCGGSSGRRGCLAVGFDLGGGLGPDRPLARVRRAFLGSRLGQNSPAGAWPLLVLRE